MVECFIKLHLYALVMKEDSKKTQNITTTNINFIDEKDATTTITNQHTSIGNTNQNTDTNET